MRKPPVQTRHLVSASSPEPSPPSPPSPEPSAPAASAPPAPEAAYLEMYRALTATPPNESAAKSAVKRGLREVLADHPIVSKYNLLIVFDSRAMARTDADRIYRAVTEFAAKKSILLVLFSSGGSISAGYLLGKLCREFVSGSFEVSVPRQAKSAATLLCCAADVVHMGSLSELGPIDPQIRDLPALGLKYSVEHIADLVKRYPAASDMFANYLHKSLQLIDLGYYERVAESAVQYAERLLGLHSANLPKPPGEIAKHLVYFYKDHGFMIDKDEAERIFGGGMIKANTDEYRLGNEIYAHLNLLSNVAEMANYGLYMNGSIDSEPELIKLKRGQTSLDS
jgi:hypothetical protein